MRAWYSTRVAYPKGEAGTSPAFRRRLRNLGAIDRYRHLVQQHYRGEQLIVPAHSVARDLIQQQVQATRRRRIRRHAVPLPQGDKDVVFPLHYFRDAQISVREPFVDQWALVADLTKALPAGSRLLVKPHPHYLGADLDRHGLHEILNNERVVVLRPDTTPADALRHAWCIVAINSTLGIEALLHGKPLVALGHDMYCRDDVAEVVRDANDLVGAFDRAVEARPQRQPVADCFLQDLAASLVPMAVNGYAPMGEEDASAMANAVATVIDQASPWVPRP